MVTNSTPEPIKLGIHDGMPEERYHAVDACSSSRLNAMARSPAHCRRLIDEPLDSDTLLLGTATHAAILEPQTFEKRFMYSPPGDGRTKAVKDARADAQIVAASRNLKLLPDDFRDKISGMAEAVRSHPAARALLDRVQAAERSIFWREREYGDLLCKARLDGWCPSIGTIIDIKTTTDASPDEFARSAWTFGYWRQAEFYRRAANVALMPAVNSIIIAVEKEPPYVVAVYRVPPEALEAADQSIDRLMTKYALCVETGEWPGYSRDVEDLNLPAWAWARLRETGLVAA